MRLRTFSEAASSALVFAFYAFVTLLGPLLRAEGNAGALEVIDAGQVRQFVSAKDQVYVRWPSGAPGNFQSAISAQIPGATVLESSASQALVQLSRFPDAAQLSAQTDEFSSSFPGVQVLPVFYEVGETRGRESRRVLTRQLLVGVAAGQSPAQIGSMVGALSARLSVEPNVGILELANPYQVLDALAVLQKAGIPASPLLGHSWGTLAIPTDQYFKDQWHLVNTGQRGGIPGIDANVLDAWNVSLGQNVTIGIVDSCLETSHPDLVENTPPINSGLHFDFIDDDADPNPRGADKHGTSAAGVAAARQNNGTANPQTGETLGVSGAAPNSRLIGLRLTSESAFTPVTDLDEATALFWKAGPEQVPIIDISNNSWGPGAYIGPDILARTALRDAVVFGRGRRGQITLFAAGNGRKTGFRANQSRESNMNGYANSRYVIAVGAVDNLGKQAFYSENGANILISAPGSGGTAGIVTTDNQDIAGYNPPRPTTPPIQDLANTDYTNQFGITASNQFEGTSASTPIVSGVASLMISANPNLGWRDVKEILASTARQVDPGDADWDTNPALSGVQDNGARFRFNHKYGAGLVDASAGVIRALEWNNLGEEVQQEIKFPAPQLPRTIPDFVATAVPPVSTTMNFVFTGPNYPNIRVEGVEVTMDISHFSRSDLEIALISPDGTRSVLVAGGGSKVGDNRDIKYSVFSSTAGEIKPGWTFTTVHHWGENSTGTWRLVLTDKSATVTGKVNSASVRLSGTPSTQQRFVFERQRDNILEPENTIGAPNREKMVKVLRLGSSVGTATVSFATSPRGSATQDGENVVNADYLPISGTLFFENGQTFKEIPVSVKNDSIPESTEAIYLLLKSPVGASLGGVSLETIEILDNDENRVTIVNSDPVATEPGAGVPVDKGVFTISRTVPSPQPLFVRYTISGTATPGLDPGDDYLPLSGTAIIPANASSTTVEIEARDDEAIEGTESVIITLAVDANYQIGLPSSAEVRIIDNDRASVRIVALTNAVLRENDPTRIATLRVSRTDDTSSPLTVNLAYEGNQINGVNYVDADASPQPLPTTIVLLAGQSQFDLHIKPINNEVYEASKKIIVSLDESAEYNFSFGFLSSAVLTVIEDDPLPDTRIPTLKVTSPRTNTRYVSPSPVMLSGSASDNGFVRKVEYRANGGLWKPIAGIVPASSVQWALSLNLPTHPTNPEVLPGANVVELRSTDDDENRSVTGVVLFTYVEETPVQIAVLGQGTVTKGFLGTTTREIGQLYSITATPTAGMVFSRWVGLRAGVNISTTTPGTPSIKEVQRIDPTKVTGSGSAFTLTFGGQTTGSITSPPSAASIQVALNGLASISSLGGVVVTPDREPGPPIRDTGLFDVTFNNNGDRPEIAGVGTRNPEARTIEFRAEELIGGSLQAEFVPSPFVTAIVGNYSGLARKSQFTFDSSAYLTLSVVPTGAFTGKLTINGVTYSLRGEFSGTGRYIGFVPRKNDDRLTLDLTIDLATSGTQRITGTLASSSFVLGVQADRAAFSKSNPPPSSIAGKQFTVLLPSSNPLSNGDFEPDGNGYGTVLIDTAGQVRLLGTLPDGTKITSTQALTKDLTWPLFLELYSRKGVAIGVVTHNAALINSDFSGRYSWFKPAKPADKYFPFGFRIDQNDITGSFYNFTSGRALAGFANTQKNASITLDFGNLANLILKVATFDESNVVAIDEATSPSKGEGLTMKVNTRDGTFSGSFTHPLGGKKVPIQGVLFQKQQTAIGGFLGISIPGVPLQTGRVVLKAP